MFVDKVKIVVNGGNGGNGAVSFHREKYIAAGGPDGGDGGRGGSILFQAADNLTTLSDFRYKRKFTAPSGNNGSGGRSSGKSGEDLIIQVPRGTLVKDAETGRLVADISGDEPVLIAKGGNGGWGNSHFATPTRQIPRFAKPGGRGEKLEAVLELKLLADVGLLGFPNVGKSTLISVVSSAKPVIANYHFTTISPVLGVVSIDSGASFVMADIPGIIEGASEGVGLGHEFLRHIERCRLLVHIVDVSGSEGRDPIEDFEAINKELINYNEDLAKRPQIVAGNKCDMATDEQIEKFKNYVEGKGYKFFPMMAAISKGTKEVVNYCAAELSKLPPIKVYEPETVPVAESIFEKEENFDISVRVEGDTYYVEGEWLLRVIESTNFNDNESLTYFQRTLNQKGVIDELRKAGIHEGDYVNIYDIEFEFVN